MHVPLNVNEGEGETLSESYEVGTTYPVFILTDSQGTVLRRWTGYTGGAHALIKKLESALSDLVSIDQRLARFEDKPTAADALFLARYYADTKEHLAAVNYFQKAESLSTKYPLDLSYDIFSNTANAAWNDVLPFEDVIPAADRVLASKRQSVTNIAKVGQIMTRLARKLERTEKIAKYLQAGIDATEGATDARTKDTHELLRADYALHVLHDTAGAVQIKKNSIGPNFEERRDEFYFFATWCLERRINLDEAEEFTRDAVDLVYPGKYRARVLSTLARIKEAQGDAATAVEVWRQAVEQEPENEFYLQEVKRLTDSLNSLK